MTDLDDALRIARALAKIATCMDAPAVGSIGALVAELDALEERVARGREFDSTTSSGSRPIRTRWG